MAMSNKDLFAALSHLISPGLLLSLRPAAMVAILAYLSNNPILRPRAEQFLHAWKGKWIPPVEKAEEYPEVLNAEFVRLVVRVPQFLTPEENDLYKHLHLITRVRRAASLHLQVKVGFTPTLQSLTPDFKIPCKSCGHRRSFTLMQDRTCGLCLFDVDCGKDSPEQEPDGDRSHMVECKACKALYAVIRHQDLKVQPKCHYCRHSEPAPTVQCVACGNKYCSPTALDPSRDSPFTCPCCASNPEEGQPPREVKLSELMEQNPELITCLGLLPSACKPVFDRIGLFKLWMGHREALAIGPELAVESLVWGGKPVREVPELLQTLCEAVLRGRLAETCGLCFEDRALADVQSACGFCSNHACSACLRRWYGQLAPGRLYVPSEGLCAFCKRTPKARTLRTFNRAACRLAGRRNLVLKADMYYGWCRTCFKVKELAPRDCAQEVPSIANFECEDCRLERLLSTTALDEVLAKAARKCPGCKAPSLKVSGCNHMTCPACSIDWCWQCGDQYTAEEIYSHMEDAHGNIGLDDLGDFDVEEDE